MIAEIDRETGQSRVSKWGWGLLLAVSVYLVVNGMAWFFIGPSLSTFEEDTGVPLAEFQAAYPAVADTISVNARQVAIWFMAVGLLALAVTWQGFRHGPRWVWYATWVIVGAPAAVGLNVLDSGGFTYGAMMLGLAAIALLGQLLARTGLSS